MRVGISFIAVLGYWFLDAYKDVLNFKISFFQAVLLDYEQASVLLKIIISLMIFAFIYIKKNTIVEIIQEPVKELPQSSDMLNSICKVSEVILSPIPLQKQLSTIINILEDQLQLDNAFVGSFEKDYIYIHNHNESLSKIGIKEKYLLQKNNLAQNSLDAQILKLFTGEEDFIDSIVDINGTQYRSIASTYKESHSKKNIGVFCVILSQNDENNYTQFITTISEQISFTINFDKKKKDAFKAQNIFNEKFSLTDKELDIPTNAKLQQLIEREVQRSQRYGSELSLMIIEIDYLKNLSNILTPEEVLTIKREIANLLKKGVRDTDLFGKWTETRFAIVAPDIDFRAAKSFANKLNRNLSEHRFHKVGKITCSFGITSFSQKDTIGTLRQRAENALDEALKSGGNAIEIKILV